MAIPTAAHIDALLNFLEEHRDLAHGSLKSIEGRALNRRLLDDICNTLNAMGGCVKTTKQWQKVWTDKKHLAKKQQLHGGLRLPLKVDHLQLLHSPNGNLGDGFGEPQTSARTQAVVEHSSQELNTASTYVPSNQGDLSLLNATRQRRQSRRHPESLQAGTSVRDRLFRSEERRLVLEEQRNVELAGIRMAVIELIRVVQAAAYAAQRTFEN